MPFYLTSPHSTPLHPRNKKKKRATKTDEPPLRRPSCTDGLTTKRHHPVRSQASPIQLFLVRFFRSNRRSRTETDSPFFGGKCQRVFMQTPAAVKTQEGLDERGAAGSQERGASFQAAPVRAAQELHLLTKHAVRCYDTWGGGLGYFLQ